MNILTDEKTETSFEKDVMRRLVNLEHHIINLIVPLQGINEVLKTPQHIVKLVEALNKPIPVDTGKLTSLLFEYRQEIGNLKNKLDQFAKDLEKLDTIKTHGEIKFIGKKLSEIEALLRKIKEDGIKKKIDLEISCDGYELIKKPVGYNKEDPVEQIDTDLKSLLDTLPKREAQSLVHRFGLFGEKYKTFEGIGKIFGITRERVRQITAKALRKCRHPKRIELARKIKHDKLRIAICGE